MSAILSPLRSAPAIFVGRLRAYAHQWDSFMSAKILLTPAAKIIRELEEHKGRKLEPWEIWLSLEQARMVGELGPFREKRLG